MTIEMTELNSYINFNPSIDDDMEKHDLSNKFKILDQLSDVSDISEHLSQFSLNEYSNHYYDDEDDSIYNTESPRHDVITFLDEIKIRLKLDTGNTQNIRTILTEFASTYHTFPITIFQSDFKYLYYNVNNSIYVQCFSNWCKKVGFKYARHKSGPRRHGYSLKIITKIPNNETDSLISIKLANLVDEFDVTRFNTNTLALLIIILQLDCDEKDFPIRIFQKEIINIISFNKNGFAPIISQLFNKFSSIDSENFLVFNGSHGQGKCLLINNKFGQDELRAIFKFFSKT